MAGKPWVDDSWMFLKGWKDGWKDGRMQHWKDSGQIDACIGLYLYMYACRSPCKKVTARM